MLSKQPAELSLADAQAFGEAIDTAFIECASVDQRQRPRYGVRRPAPGGKLWRRFRPTAQARAEASFLRRCCRRVERHVFPFRHRCRADRTAIDPGCPDPAKQPTVEARVASTERAITRVNIEVHDPIVAPGRAECLAVFGHHRQAMRTGNCMGQSSQRRTFADHDRTRRPLDKARQNRRHSQYPFDRPILRAARAFSSMRSNGWTTVWSPCSATRGSVERIWMTRTRAYRVRTGARCFARRSHSGR